MAGSDVCAGSDYLGTFCFGLRLTGPAQQLTEIGGYPSGNIVTG